MKKLIVAVILSLIVFGSGAAAGDQAAPVSGPMVYKGHSKKEFDGFWKTSYYVPMSDGVRIAVDVYLPDKAPAGRKFPAVMEYTPYSRSFLNPAFKPLEKSKGRNMFGGRGAEIPNPFCFSKLLVEHGYAMVLADVRGSGASFGARLDLMPRLGDDGKELVDWIAKQPWSDGNVGMRGGSYMAITSILTAGRKPKALKGIFIMVYPFGYQDIYPGGVYNQGFMSRYAKLLWSMNMNINKMGGDMIPSMPSAPVVDEDGDGEMLDEIPIDRNGDGSFVDDYKYPEDPNDPPQYSDGNARKNLYFLATKEHLKNAYVDSWISKANFIDSDTKSIGLDTGFGSFNGYDISPISMVPAIMKSGIPIYHVGGWMDAQPRSAMLFFNTARKTNPSKLLMFPGYHILSSPFYKYFGEDQDRAMKGIQVEALRFFDRWLKGVKNGIDTEPPVTLYVMGKGWRQENEWPLARAVSRDFYFSEGNRLSTAASAAGADTYKTDFTHDSSFGPKKGNRWLMIVVPDEVPDRAEMDKRCLTYTTEPLEAATEVTGSPIVDIWVSSTAGSGDFFAYLEDVDENGKAILVTENPMKAGFAGLRNINNMIERGKTGTEVLPKIPWHGYEKADYAEDVFKGGAAVNLKFDLQPTSWVFPKGHRIRVSIAAADWPTFRLDPRLSPSNRADDPANIAPTITVLRDGAHPSRITLPVVAE